MSQANFNAHGITSSNYQKCLEVSEELDRRAKLLGLHGEFYFNYYGEYHLVCRNGDDGDRLIGVVEVSPENALEEDLLHRFGGRLAY